MTLLDALTAALSTAVLVLAGATVALFLPLGSTTPWTERRLWSAAAVVAAVSMTVVGLFGGTPFLAAVVAVMLTGSLPVWAPTVPGWAARGVVVWSMGLNAAVLYLAYVTAWMVTDPPGPAGLAASSLLLVLEAFVLLLAAGYSYELVDLMARRRWDRSVRLEETESAHRPFVSLHVPAHNEPPDMVIETLSALLRLDYEDFEILMVDDNTVDESLWRPVEEFCRQHDRIRFFHLEDWPGYKSGALNFALTQTDPRAEVVGVVDSDYLVDPDFLARCAPLFADPGLSFVQTPQDYRDWEQAPYFRRLYHSYGYFFDVSQRSRSEADAAIFGGTMGLIRKDDLQAVGGWDEWCITEDAELSLRLLRRGGSGLHIDRSFGRGVMPLTFEALKRQRFRWCFGGIQILRMHLRSLLPWNRDPDNRLSQAQRWSYLVGGLQWFGDLAGLAFTGFLMLGALDLAFGDGLVVRRLAGLVLVCVVALLVIGVLRSVVLLKRVRNTTWRDAIGAFGIWMGLGWAVALGAARGLVAREGAFLRTPKVKGELTWRDALRGNRPETLLAVAAFVVAAVAFAQESWPGVLLGSLLVWQGLGYSMAPLNSLAAIRADLPADLRGRRLLPTSWAELSLPARRAVLWPPLVGAAMASALVVLAAPADAPIGPDLRNPGGPRAEAETRIDPASPTRLGGAGATTSPEGATATAPVSTAPVGATTSTTAATDLTAGPPVGGTATPAGQTTAAPSGPGQGTSASGATPTQPTQAQPTQAQPTQAQPTQAQPTQAPSGKGRPTEKPSQKPTDKGKPPAPGSSKGAQPTPGGAG